MRLSCAVLITLGLGCAHAPAGPSALVAPTDSVGVAFRKAADPVSGKRLPLAVFYPPAGRESGHLALEYDLPARQDAPPAPGRHPLVVVSHGHGGGFLGHHDLCEALARAGNVVVAVHHLGDSYDDQTGVGSDRVLYGRAYQVRAAIDAVLADPVLGPLVDPDRIGIAGFSAGGYTSLLVLGAEPDFGRMAPYCARHPSDHEVCQFSELRRELSDRPPTRDPRVKAGFVMAPFAVPFGPQALKAVTAPVFLAWAGADQLLLPDENALPVRDGLAHLWGTDELTGAGHYVFLAPCSPVQQRRVPEICQDPPGIDRAALHSRLADEAVRFFAQTL